MNSSLKRTSNTNKVLTEAMIVQKTKVTDISEVKFLTLWGQQLTDVSIIEKMPNLEAITLSVNKIETLKPFAKCKKLKELLLRNNNISDFIELTYLADLPELRTLWLSDNPIAKEDNYRIRVLQILPNLHKIDEAEVTEEERQMKLPVPQPQTAAQKNTTGHLQQTGKQQIHPRKNDAPVLTAVLSLLPELSVDSLQVVLRKIKDLTQQ